MVPLRNKCPPAMDQQTFLPYQIMTAKWNVVMKKQLQVILEAQPQQVSPRRTFVLGSHALIALIMCPKTTNRFVDFPMRGACSLIIWILMPPVRFGFLQIAQQMSPRRTFVWGSHALIALIMYPMTANHFVDFPTQDACSRIIWILVPPVRFGSLQSAQQKQ